ncbi:DMT family transporter [Poseidonocella sp. HB161398]|uniref:DMT family transporter n=1 Tax=Poseidonocella sp. HB161398 TaxID=2320855 RepID=UPI00110930C5|nr:DMT family transporter [Poseidonocella sp. HB161398]
MRKDRMDMAGAAGLVLFAAIFALNQVVIKVTNGGFQPIFGAGLRGIGAGACLLLWVWWRKIPLSLPRDAWPGAALIGLCFTMEYICLFLSLDMTSVARSVVIFYSMPVWLTLAGHFLIPGERITRFKALGLAFAVAGVGVALANRSGGQTSLAGDLLALGAAFSWTGIALCARVTKLREVAPETQLMCQLVISTVLLLAISPFFGPFLRDLAAIHLWGLAFQSVIVASGGFLFWLWVLSIYPAGAVASFSFLTPVFGVFLGWGLLGEHLGPEIFLALALVAAGLLLINRPVRGVRTS